MKFLHSKNRIEALSDGVFAFAATLMVVDIGSTTEIATLKDKLPSFISFAASFFIMMALWKVHYNYLRRTNYIDNWIIALNMIFLFTVLFYIFPVKSLLDSALMKSRMNFDDFSNLFQIYSVGFSLMFLCVSLIYFRAFKKEESSDNKNILLFYCRHFLIFVLVGLVSTIIAKLQIGLRFGAPGIVYTSLGVLCYLHSVSYRKKYPLD